jgi:hypothetical protein
VRIPTSRSPSLAVVLVAAALAPGAAGAARPRVALRVAIDPEARSAIGRVAIEIENPTAAPLDRLELWSFPARLARPSPAIDEHNFYWLYPYRFDGAAMRVEGVRVDGRPAAIEVRDAPHAGPGTLLVVPLASPLPPGGRVRLEADFATRLPRRYGAFGCYQRTCTLAGGFYPMPVSLSAAGFDESAPPARADVSIAVDVPAGDAVLLGGALAPDGRARLEDVAYPTVVVGRGFRYHDAEYLGVKISFVQRRGATLPPAPPGKAAPYVLEDRAALVLDDAREALSLLHEQGLDLAPGETLPLVEAPLRMELAEPHGGVVLVSDQIFRILPIDRFRKFHSFQLVRAIFHLLLERRLAARERPDDIGWSPDGIASWLVDLYTLRYYRREEYAKEILRWVAFIPTIDRLLYAPQVQFASAYFNTLDEPDPTRDDLSRFANERPRGKTIYEKLRDLVGDEGIARIARAAFRGVPLREAAEAEHGSPLDGFFAQWLGPYPEVDYRFQVLGSARSPTGGGLRYRIRVWKRGTHPPVEPVELRVTEWGGARHELRWDGRGRETVLEVDTARAIRSVELDPRGRLLQRIAADNDDLRLHDRSPAPWKFIYNNLGALINFQTLQLDLSLDFTLQPIYDVKNSFRFVLYRNESTQVGGLASYTRSFGRMVTPARLTSAFTSTLRVARLEPGFGRADEAPLPGTRISLAAGVGYDDRFFVWEPWRYRSIAGSLTYSLTVLDSGHAYQQVTASWAASRLFPIAPGHGVVFETDGAITVGDLRVASQALYAGGPSGLRGYEADELPGRAELQARVEYRHVFVHDLDVNLLHLLYLRGVAGGLFVEAGAVTGAPDGKYRSCDGYGLTAHDLFGDVGYSLRLLGDWLGVSQTTFNIDVAVPLVRRTRTCFAEPGAVPVDASRRAPFGFFVYFGPVW